MSYATNRILRWARKHGGHSWHKYKMRQKRNPKKTTVDNLLRSQRIGFTCNSMMLVMMILPAMMMRVTSMLMLLLILLRHSSQIASSNNTVYKKSRMRFVRFSFMYGRMHMTPWGNRDACSTSLKNKKNSRLLCSMDDFSFLQMNDDDDDKKTNCHTNDGVDACIVPCFAFYPALSA